VDFLRSSYCLYRMGILCKNGGELPQIEYKVKNIGQ
jgi:hypothetical protein